MVKPFPLEELVLKIKAIAKRTQLSSVVRLRDLEILVDEQSVILDGNELKLTLKEYLLLGYLADRQGYAISRTELIDYLWGGDSFSNDSTLDVYIANLRKKL